MRTNTASKINGLLIAAALTFNASLLQAALVTNWIAFNDHNPSAITAPNANTYNMRGVAGQPAQPTEGFLKDYLSGNPTPAYFLSTATGTPDFFGSISYPNAGTPAYNLFNGIVDLGNTDSAIGIRSSANSTVTLTFSNLNPSARYIFRGTCVRGNNYLRRWTLSTILGTDGFTNAHTAGVYTRDNFPTGTMATNQASYNVGENRADGAVIGWNDIAPGADGVFQVKCEQYVDNPLPNGQTPDLTAYGYAFAGIMIAEVGEPTPVSISNQPIASVTLEENRPLTLSVTALGTPTPAYLWYHDNTAIPTATTRTYTVNRAQLTDAGNYYVVVTNLLNSVTSTVAHVTVLPDTNRPAILAAASANGTVIGLTFSEQIDPTSVMEPLNYVVNGGAVGVNSAAARPDGKSVFLVVDTPLTTPFTVSASLITDLAGNEVTANSVTGSVRNLLTVDVGQAGTDPTAPGSTFTSNNTEYEVTAGGSDIWANGDHGHIAMAQRTGNFDVRVHLVGLTQSDPVSKAGLMVRETADSGSRNLYINANPAGGRNQIELGTRRTNDMATESWGSTFVPAGIPNLWLRLQRFGNTFYGYRSTNGLDWVLMGTSTQVYPASILVGMAATAHNNAAPPTVATFQNFGDFTYPGGSIVISQQPQSVSIPQNESVTFSVAAQAVNMPQSELRYQWTSNGVAIAGATSPSLSRQFVQRATDNGVTYNVVVSGPGVSVTSSNALLTVTTDTVRPKVRYVISPSPNLVLAYYSEPMGPPDTLFYVISNATSTIDLSSAVLDSTDPTLVRITTLTALTPGQRYTLLSDGAGIVDTSGNPISPNPSLDDFLSQNFTGDLTTIHLVPTNNMVPIGTLTTRGFNARIIQVATGIANDNGVAEQLLAGTYLNPGTGLPYPNIATVSNFVSTNIINYKAAAADAEGRITNDMFFPGIPGTTGSRENIAMEVLTYLELQPGIYRFGVNSDDGFRVTPATSVNDPDNSLVLGEFNGGRGAADTTYDVVVTKPGLYPMRLIYEQGTGGANLEWWTAPTLDVAGGVAAVNDTNGVPAYRIVAAASSRLAVGRAGPNIVLSWPLADSGFSVEQRTNLTDVIWTPAGSGTVSNGQNTLVLPIQPGSRFFRLKQ